MPRAPLIAIAALLVLAGAAGCSDTVPPPGATLSGFVYYDANANGVRDSCDANMGAGIATIALTPAAGGSSHGSTINDGAWRVQNIAPGDYLVTLKGPGFSSSEPAVLTEPVDDSGGRHYNLSLDGFETIDGLDFGMAVRPLQTHVSGYNRDYFVFQDQDGDGAADAGECPMNISGQVIDEMTRQAAEPLPIQIVEPPRGIELWSITTSEKSLLCDRGSERRGDENVPQAIGVEPATGTARLLMLAYHDLDEDGERDTGEPMFDEIFPSARPIEWSCLMGKATGEKTAKRGVYQIANLPAATYEPGTSIPELHPLTNVPWVRRTSAFPESVTLHEGETIEIEDGWIVPMRRDVTVAVVEDSNSNGVADDDERPIAGVPVCYGDHQPAVEEVFYIGCRETDADGRITFEGVYSESFVVAVDPPAAEEAQWMLPLPQVIGMEQGPTPSVTLLVVRRASSGGLPGCTAISC